MPEPQKLMAVMGGDLRQAYEIEECESGSTPEVAFQRFQTGHIRHSDWLRVVGQSKLIQVSHIAEVILAERSADA